MPQTDSAASWPNYREDDFVIKDYRFASGEALPDARTAAQRAIAKGRALLSRPRDPPFAGGRARPLNRTEDSASNR